MNRYFRKKNHNSKLVIPILDLVETGLEQYSTSRLFSYISISMAYKEKVFKRDFSDSRWLSCHAERSFLSAP